jgi:hypothetical protein
MSEENKAIARRVIEELLNTGNPEIADKIFASGCVDPNPSPNFVVPRTSRNLSTIGMPPSPILTTRSMTRSLKGIR